MKTKLEVSHEEVLEQLNDFANLIEKIESRKWGWKTASKAARKLARKLKNEVLPAWIRRTIIEEKEG